MAEEEGFISRWSRRKDLAKRTEPATRAEDASPPEDRGAVAAPQRIAVEDLPDIETMSIDSDFSAFLQDGVPDELRTAALRRLWRLDPVFANLDGLLEYGDDYTDAATVVENLKTAYRVGRGFLDDEEEIAAIAEKETEDVPDDAANNSEASKKEHNTHENAKDDKAAT